MSAGRKGLEEKAEKIYRGSQKNGFIRKCVMRTSWGVGGGGKACGCLLILAVISLWKCFVSEDAKDRLAVSGWNAVTVLMRCVYLLFTCVCKVLVITGDLIEV